MGAAITTAGGPGVGGAARAGRGAVAGEAREPARRRVLIVEDNVDAAETLRDVLELDGHEVAVAFRGTDGLREARALHPDVVLCDLGLPGLDGYEVARALRGDPTCAGLFLVALSGYALPEDRQRALDAGFDRHLAKPVDPDELMRLLADVR